MKKQYVVIMLVLVSMAGCGRKRKKVVVTTPQREVATEVDIPVANTNVREFFSDDLGELALIDETPTTQAQADQTINATSWVNESQQVTDELKVVYFNFDEYTIRADQKQILDQNLSIIKQKLAAAENPEQVTIVIDGHACDSAGTRLYNLVLSRNRAKVLADYLSEQGIPTECIKIVGRGVEMPAVINGELVTGSREQQWPNRRDEIRILYS